eukprot:51787-Eustigmatos_ZCMA.PRE.1
MNGVPCIQEKLRLPSSWCAVGLNPLELDPEFQQELTAWRGSKAAGLIESVLRRRAIAPLYFIDSERDPGESGNVAGIEYIFK